MITVNNCILGNCGNNTPQHNTYEQRAHNKGNGDFEFHVFIVKVHCSLRGGGFINYFQVPEPTTQPSPLPPGLHNCTQEVLAVGSDSPILVHL